MGYLNSVVQLIDEGHIAAWRATSYIGGKPHMEVATDCKRCMTPWPCPPILQARQNVRRLHGIKEIS